MQKQHGFGRGGQRDQLVFDNCVGQNKNNMVLRMLILLVKKKICLKATAIFLVRGHTKNDADRAYNLLKLLYRKQNIYTPEDLWGALNDQEKCNCVMVSSDIFKDWKSMEDKYLSEIKDVTKNHIFLWMLLTLTLCTIQEYDGQPVEKQSLVKKTAPTDWYEGFVDSLDTLPRPGIQDIKWVELYTKYAKLIPEEKR
jgi:hypothetical protein